MDIVIKRGSGISRRVGLVVGKMNAILSESVRPLTQPVSLPNCPERAAWQLQNRKTNKKTVFCFVFRQILPHLSCMEMLS